MLKLRAFLTVNTSTGYVEAGNLPIEELVDLYNETAEILKQMYSNEKK